jgi:exopolysaccharide production protein ExoQ
MIRIFDFAFAVFGMFYMSEGFAAILATPAALEEVGETGSPAIRNLGILIGIIAMTRLATDLRTVREIMMRSWPLWLPVGVALASTMWSGDPGLALRRSSALVLTTLFALFLVSRLDARAIVNGLLVALLLYCVGSVFLILFVPSIGVHTASDTRFFEHIGAWRGLSPFKNDFGRIVALAGVVFIVAGFTRASGRVLYLIATLLAAALVAGSKSAQSITLFIICAAAVFYIVTLRRLSPQSRSAVVVLTIPAVLLMYLVADTAISWILEALGKDPTLTGRMNIWPAVVAAMHDNLLLGGGYGTGWEVLVNNYMKQVLGREIGHAHNGYLNLIVDLGVVGLLVMLGFLAAVSYRIYVELVRERNWELVLLASTVLVFILVGNWVGSFLCKYNTIFWVLIVCIYCKLGERQGSQRISVQSEPGQTPEFSWREAHDLARRIPFAN